MLKFEDGKIIIDVEKGIDTTKEKSKIFASKLSEVYKTTKDKVKEKLEERAETQNVEEKRQEGVDELVRKTMEDIFGEFVDLKEKVPSFYTQTKTSNEKLISLRLDFVEDVFIIDLTNIDTFKTNKTLSEDLSRKIEEFLGTLGHVDKELFSEVVIKLKRNYLDGPIPASYLHDFIGKTIIPYIGEVSYRNIYE